jgi:hypothetical protein
VRPPRFPRLPALASPLTPRSHRLLGDNIVEVQLFHLGTLKAHFSLAVGQNFPAVPPALAYHGPRCAPGAITPLPGVHMIAALCGPGKGDRIMRFRNFRTNPPLSQRGGGGGGGPLP